MIAALQGSSVERFRVMVARRLGLQFDDSKLEFLSEVLSKHAEPDDLHSPPEVAQQDRPLITATEVSKLAEDLTVAETYFFRNIEQFRVLGEIAMPELLQVRDRRRPLRILSAGCSSGEEAYSIAMTVDERFPHLSRREVEIEGVDIVPSRIERARLARYPPWSLRETQENVKALWFQQKGQEFRLVDRIRDMADFKLVNLAEDGTSVSEAVAYDIVFCRNVLMYFTPDQARMLVGRIARALAPGGYLFLGHAETLRGLTQDFHLCQAHGAFYYVRKGPCRQPCTGASSVVRELGASSAGLDEMARAARSWVDVIGRASDRIQVLAEKRKPDDHALNGGDAAGGARGLVGAMELLQRERYQDALACVATLPRESARDPEVLLLRAVLQTHGGNLPEAEAICRLLLEIDELNSGAHYVMALCKEALGDGKGAAEHDRIAVHLDPGFAMPRLHLGLLARRNGERTSARRELERALALLEREDPSRLLLFGGGFGRAALVALCRAELTASGGAP